MTHGSATTFYIIKEHDIANDSIVTKYIIYKGYFCLLDDKRTVSILLIYIGLVKHMPVYQHIVAL
jgi:hypothetical protein